VGSKEPIFNPLELLVEVVESGAVVLAVGEELLVLVWVVLSQAAKKKLLVRVAQLNVNARLILGIISNQESKA